MRRSAIKKAIRRLRNAKESLPGLRELQKSVHWDDFEQAWFRFLGDMNSVHEVLKTGSKENPRSRQWFAGQERTIRKDPLLRYLLHSRGVDFHGDERLLLLRTTAGDPAPHDFGLNDPRPPKYHLNLFIPAHVQQMTLWYEPQIVRDAHGNTFAPPAEHLGTRLRDRSPAGMAEAAIPFYERLVTEAARYEA